MSKSSSGNEPLAQAVALLRRSNVREGKPFPLGATWDGLGVNLRCFPPMPQRSSCVCSTQANASSSASSCRNTPMKSGMAICPTARPARLRLPRSRALRAGRRAPVQSEQAADRSLRQAARRPAAMGTGAVWLPTGPSRQGQVLRRARQRAVDAEVPRHRPRLHLGHRPQAETPWERTILYEMHVKGFTKLHPLVPEAERGTFAGLANPRVPAYLRRSASRARNCCRSTRSSTTTTSSRKACAITGATIRSPSSRRSRAICNAFSERIQAMVNQFHASGHRGDPRRGLQPHGGRQRTRAHLSFKGIDNASYYRLMPDQTALLHQRHRHRKYGQPLAPARAADGRGLLALLGDGDARRRIPVRPCDHPGTRAIRL